MVPLTDLSAVIVTVAVPDADVVTGGVSCAPVNSTFRSTAKADPLPMINAADAISPRMLVTLMKRFMFNSIGHNFEGWGGETHDCSAPAGWHAISPRLHHDIQSAYGRFFRALLQNTRATNVTCLFCADGAGPLRRFRAHFDSLYLNDQSVADHRHPQDMHSRFAAV